MAVAERLKQFAIMRDGQVLARGVILPSGQTLHEFESATPSLVYSLNLKAVELNLGKGSSIVLIEDERDMLREYYFVRLSDVNGNSGTGVVTRGVEFPSRRVAHEWIPTGTESLNIYDNYKQAIEMHGHNGATVLRWVGKDGLPDIE